MKEIIQLKVSLLQSKPNIWRQILVHKDTSFFELHHIIQISMGWANYHMFEFGIEGYRIGEVIEDEINDGYGSDRLLNSIDVTLKDIISKEKEIINYQYDFGDNWQHQIKVEKFLSIDTSLKYPSCVNGEMNCPPEDCGGISSFYYHLEVLKDKKNPDYKEISEWFDKKYDPEKFDKLKVNKQLEKLEKYIIKWINGE